MLVACELRLNCTRVLCGVSQEFGLTNACHRFMAASKVLGEETVNGANAADASQSKRG